MEKNVTGTSISNCDFFLKFIISVGGGHCDYLSVASGVPGGGFRLFKPPSRNSEGPPKNRAKLNQTVKTVKKNC